MSPSNAELREETSAAEVHPFAHTKNLLVLIPDKIDVEEESQLYDDLCDVRSTPLIYAEWCFDHAAGRANLANHRIPSLDRDHPGDLPPSSRGTFG